MSGRRRCFLISPIGAEGSPERAHADDVYEFIVKPAMDECGTDVVRSDQMHMPGAISEQMYREIAEDDLCIAVLTGANPNVYYELAVAHALARPVIIVLLKGEPLPFDIKDLRCVYYDLNPKPLRDGVYVDEIVGHVKHIEGLGWRMPSVLSGVTNADRGDVELMERAERLGDNDAWLGMLSATERHFDVMGVSLWSWMQTEGFEDLLARKAESGCRVRIVLAHPDSPAFPQLSQKEMDPSERERSKVSIRATLAGMRPLQDRFADFEVRQLQRGIPHFQLTRTDQVAVAIPYWHTVPPANAPMLRCASTSPVCQLFVQDFPALWSLNAPDEASSSIA